MSAMTWKKNTSESSALLRYEQVEQDGGKGVVIPYMLSSIGSQLWIELILKMRNVMIVTKSLQDSEIEDGFESPADLAEAEVPDEIVYV